MLKNKCSPVEIDGHHQKISIYVGTFNMGEVNPPRDISQMFDGVGEGLLLPTPGLRHDIYAIGTQEGTVSEQNWAAAVKQHIGDSYHQVRVWRGGGWFCWLIPLFPLRVKLAVVNLWQMRLLVLVKKELVTKISHIQTSSVATGIANALGNKGAVGASFFVGSTSLCFVNCHLAAGSEKWSKRNANYRDILVKLQLGQKRLPMFDITNQFHHLFWCVRS